MSLLSTFYGVKITTMRIDTGQHLRIDQRMKLAPRMIQSMEILQMPWLALEERIDQELASNPTLELSEPDSDASLDADRLREERAQADRDSLEGERELVVEDESVNRNNADDFERLSNLSEEYGEAWASNLYDTGGDYANRSPLVTGERDGKLDAMANTAARSRSLAEQLLAQWALIDAPEAITAAGQYLIGFIDDDGYIRTDRQAILDQAPPGMTGSDLDAALHLLQRTLEPVGLAARDLQECLLLQIDAKASGESRVGNGRDLSVERLLVSEYLKDIENNRLPRIAKSTGLDLEQIKQGIMSLRQFHPRPGRLLVEDRPRVVTPDAVIEYDEQQDRYVAVLTNDRMPKVRINRGYAKMARDRMLDRKSREFIGHNLRSAQWLIEAIEQRNSTLLRVINVVLDAQRDYFDKGSAHLKPLPMTTVADQLGIHVATVSRAVHEKYLQTARGIIPLRMFFSGGTATEKGDEMSWAAIQAKLEQIIQEEDKKKPLSDDQLVEKLKEQGIEIARRTVAKYRKQLNILPARQRKEF